MSDLNQVLNDINSKEFNSLEDKKSESCFFVSFITFHSFNKYLGKFKNCQ